MATRLLLVDDHPPFRAGLRALLERDRQLVVVGEASTTSDARELSSATEFDAAIVDVVVPVDGGASVVWALRARNPGCRILALSMLDDPIRIAQMLRAGANGYALKSEPVETILAAVREVLRGEPFLSPKIATAEVEQLVASDRLPLELLTTRERDVFDLLVRGETNAQIAGRLAIAQSTVETHRRHIMRKLDAGSIVDLIHLAARHGALGSRAPTAAGADR